MSNPLHGPGKDVPCSSSLERPIPSARPTCPPLSASAVEALMHARTTTAIPSHKTSRLWLNYIGSPTVAYQKVRVTATTHLGLTRRVASMTYHFSRDTPDFHSSVSCCSVRVWHTDRLEGSYFRAPESWHWPSFHARPDIIAGLSVDLLINRLSHTS